MHACYHAALGDWPLRLASLRDMAEMLRAADQDGKVLIRTTYSFFMPHPLSN